MDIESIRGKVIVVGVGGGIAAYKACEIVSSLRKMGADVHVIMTKNAVEFVNPLTFEALSGNPVTVEMFGAKRMGDVRHISLARSASLAVIAPCTANVIGKIASGIADDFLSTFVMACKANIVLCPAMNTAMYESNAYQHNASILKKRGFLFVEPEDGRLACGDSGRGRLAEPQRIVEYLTELLGRSEDFVGKRLLITAGGTISPIDPVRCIANHSSGKMGIELARAAAGRGGDVTLVLGRSTVEVDFPCQLIRVTTTDDMYEQVMANLDGMDYIIKAAAPSDYVVVEKSDTKLKSDQMSLTLKKGVDIAREVGKKKGNARLVIFAAETDNTISNAQEKLARKNADMVVANNILQEGAGFEVDTNIATIILGDGRMVDCKQMSKRELASVILDQLIRLA